MEHPRIEQFLYAWMFFQMVRIPVKVTSDSGLYVSTDRSVATLAIVFI